MDERALHRRPALCMDMRVKAHLASFFSDTPSFVSQPDARVDRWSVCNNHTLLRIDARAHQERAAPSHQLWARAHRSQALLRIDGLLFATATRSCTSTRGRINHKTLFASMRGRWSINHMLVYIDGLSFVSSTRSFASTLIHIRHVFLHITATCSCLSMVSRLYQTCAPSHLPSFIFNARSFASQQNTSVDRRSVVSINHTRLLHIDPRALHRRPAFPIDPRAHQPRAAPSHRSEV